MAWKEMKKSKSRFFILGTIVFLVSLLTFMISGLANGLSYDSAGLIKELPDGQFFMTNEAEENANQSRINDELQTKILNQHEEAVAFSIQMGMVVQQDGKQQNVAFVTSTDSKWFPKVQKGEIILDQSVQEAGIKVGDELNLKQPNQHLIVKGFANQSKYSHAPVAYIHIEDYQQMTQMDDMQIIYLPGGETDLTIEGLQSFSKKKLLNTIVSYKAEQLSLNMIVWFLVVISGMLFAIFFYMLNVQKMGLYGILKAIGVKTSTLYKMMWTQMALITFMALSLSIVLSQLFEKWAPTEVPFNLTIDTIGLMSFVFFIIGFMGATLSGIQIQKVEPLHAIQQGDI